MLGTNCGNESDLVLRHFTFTLRTLMNRRNEYWANSVQKFLRSWACTSVTVNLRLLSPRVRISTLLLSTVLNSTANGLPSVVVAVTFTFFTFMLC